MTKTVDYFFTPSSPWTYLGHPRLVAITSIHGADVKMKPCDLGKVFSISGGLPLKARPQQRQDYRLVELKRWSTYLNTKLNVHPKFFPVPADRAAEYIIAAHLAHGTHAALSLAFGVMRGVWADERNIDDPETLAKITEEVGLDPASLATDKLKTEARARYEANTAEAIEQKVFGAPWYVYNGEPFWGQDRLDFLERAIAK